ncbi:MAG: transporter substrate-binding domain-containing protein [Deltaproteobacteria bacterium]|nr:transporter substrate-binding domain-containing protein [Deltaproteobacteria bacterium]
MNQKTNQHPHHFLQSLIFVILVIFVIQSQPVCDSIASVPAKDGISQINPSVSRDEQGGPAAQGLSLTPEESAWLADHPEITIAINQAWPPMDHTDADGTPQGIGVGFIRALNGRLGGRLKIVPLPWTDMVEAGKERRIDALMDITPRPDREPFFHFTRPYLIIPHSIIARQDAPYYQDLSGLAGKTVGVERRFFIERVFREKYPDIRVRLFDTTSDALDAVSKGILDAYVGNRAVAMYIMERELITNLKVHGKVQETASINAIGVRKDWPVLRDILQKALDDLNREEVSAILKKWVDLDEAAAAAAVQLSPAEEAWLQDHPKVRIGIMNDWPPMNFVDETGKPQGIGVDFVEALNGRLRGILTIEAGPFDNNLDRVKNRELDALMDITPTKDREPYFDFTIPYLTIPHVLVGRRDGPYFKSEKDLNGKTVALERSYYNVQYFRDHFPDVKTREYASTSEALDAVSRGEADAYAGNRAAVTYLIEKELMANLRVMGRMEKPPVVLCIGVRKDWSLLAGLLDRALASITREEVRGIHRKWLDVMQDARTSLDLTPQERAWLRDHPVLRLGYDTDWPPVEYVNKEGKLVGMSADFMEKLNAIIGIDIKPTKPQSWQATLDEMREGTIDILFSATRTPQREEFLHFSEPYLRFPMVIVTDQGAPYVGDMKDLRGKKIAVVNGYASHDILKHRHPELDLLLVDDVTTGLTDVTRRKAYAFIDSLAAISHVIGREGISGVKVSGETPYSYQISVAVPEDQPILAGIIQKALNSISEEDRNAIFKRWISVTYERKFDYRMLWKVLLAVMLIFSAVLYWNRRLAREINLRKKIEGELVEAKEAAETSNRVKSAFLASMSHELRTPLNSIIGFTGIILNELAGPLNLEQKKQLKMVKGSSHHLLNLINDVLDISKIEAGEVEITKNHFSMPQVIDQVVESLRPLAEQKGLSLFAQIDPDVDRVVSDERRIRQILINLANNAIKFTENGGVRIVCRRQDSAIEVRVTDTGIGIRSEDMGKLFKPFQQLDTGTARRYEGTGLGLSVCKRILDMLGGRIWVESQFGEGSTFAFTLPLKPEKKNDKKEDPDR